MPNRKNEIEIPATQIAEGIGTLQAKYYRFYK